MQRLNAEYAARVRPDTYFSLLDPALVRWMFCQYELALGVARWKRVRALTASENKHYNSCQRRMDVTHWKEPFGVGTQWYQYISVDTPKILHDNFAENTQRVKAMGYNNKLLPGIFYMYVMFTLMIGPYRLIVMRNDEKRKPTPFCWFDQSGKLVHYQLVSDCHEILDAAPGYIIIMDHSNRSYEMHLELDASTNAGCVVA